MPNHPCLTFAPIAPNVSHAQYLSDLKRIIDYIYAGDIYQANLTQRFSMVWEGDAWDLYSQLHRQNPAPFAAFLPYSDFQILCSSPERFICIQTDGQIETRPIKGTRPRGKSPADDQSQAFELQNNPKDRAELTMIIDLERNDLGRICEFGTVIVPDFIKLEKYPTVWHLASTITGQLRRGLKPSDIIRAVFPGGSITGAPKIRAMEIIEELELYKRGIYTGSIGYMGFDGAWDFNIVIRTILLKNGKAYIHVGGGIVADSIPESEYNETLDKAKALFQVLKGRLDVTR
jgi:para-aminobenzoate synthetase